MWRCRTVKIADSLEESLPFRCRCSLFAPRTHSQFCSLLGVLFGYVKFLELRKIARELRENCEIFLTTATVKVTVELRQVL